MPWYVGRGEAYYGTSGGAPLDLLYNEASKLNSPADIQNKTRIPLYLGSAALQADLAHPPRALAGATGTEDPKEVGVGARTWRPALRRSRRDFDRPLLEADIEEACEVYADTDWAGRGGRVVPSAGGLYPLDIYLLNIVDGVVESVRWYNPRTNCLSDAAIPNGSQSFADLWIGPPPGPTTCTAFVLVGGYTRCRAKYGDLAYRFVQMEAGALAFALQMQLSQNPLVQCYQTTELSATKLEVLLRIDGANESVATVVVAGRS